MTVGDWITVIASFASIAWLIWMVSRGHGERHAEDRARAFFDEHGRWPDEPPEAARPASEAPLSRD